VKELGFLKSAQIIFAFWIAATIISSAQATFTTLVSFNGTEAAPAGALTQATDGNFYGTTAGGGPRGHGTVFKMTPTGTLTRLYGFCHQVRCPTDGGGPVGALVQGADGSFYGTTNTGGPNYVAGTVFKITPGGTLTTLHSFCSNTGCGDGENPFGGLVQGPDGDFYGTARDGGANYNGTVFKITPAGALTILHLFEGTDGRGPTAGLTPVPDGNYFGTTLYGPIASSCLPTGEGCGTVFRMTSAGALTVLHAFDITDGLNPNGVLVRGSDGNFYGTTLYGGTHSLGTVFKVTPGGTLTTLHSFQGSPADGAYPLYAGLVQGTDGNFYGTTNIGGASSNCTNGCGTVFKITAGGVLTTLHSFSGLDGSDPQTGLVQGTDGNF